MDDPVAQEPVWWAVGASAVGAGHLRSGTPCQDAFGVRSLRGGGLIIASADGAGSAARSAEGADCAVHALLDAMESAMDGTASLDADWESTFHGAFGAARAAVERLAASGDDPLRAFATTLTCALAVGDRVAVAQIGDGLVVVEDESGQFASVPADRPIRGEYVNETVFLTGRNGLDNIILAEHAGDARAVVVSTDGLVRLAMELPAYRPFPGFLRPLLGFAASADDADAAARRLTAFLSSDRVRDRTDDDTSLVLAVRRVPPKRDSSTLTAVDGQEPTS
jgi:hypothetical protein